MLRYLERFRLRCSDAIATVSHVVPTFSGREPIERGGHKGVDVIERPRPRCSEEGFQFGERELDRIEVGTVGRQKAELRTDAFDRRADRRLFVDGQVIEHHDVAWSQRGHQDLFDIRLKTWTVDGPIEHGGRADALEPQGGDDRVRLPMAAGCVIVEPFAAGTAPISAQQVGGDPTLVEEHVLAHIPEWLPHLPAATVGDHVRPSLFVGVYGFF
jgi:hypothetical protein